MSLQLLLVLLGLCLESQKRQVQQALSVCPWQTRAGSLTRLTLSAIMFRKASNTLSATAITHCIIPETRGVPWSGASTERDQRQLLSNVFFFGHNFRLTEECPYTLHPASPDVNIAFVKTKNRTLRYDFLNFRLYMDFSNFPTSMHPFSVLVSNPGCHMAFTHHVSLVSPNLC